MAEQQSKVDSNFQQEEEEEPKQKFDMTQPKKMIPVKTQIKNLEIDIANIRKDLNENKKHGNMLRGELLSLEGTIKDRCNELSKCIIDDLTNFDKDFKRVIQNDRTETDFFKVQINSLNEDKIKLKKETVSSESRMRTCEVEVGVDPR